jgi:uncharacterized phage protein gp47/JayE
MSEYGVTPTGVVIKRLDTIMDELHDDLTEGWGVNTRLNPKSYLNVQLTANADKFAELWEFGEQLYHAMYPFSAEDASLDNAVQFGGIEREVARPTIYPIHAECVDGTVIPQNTLIRSDTNPTAHFLAAMNTTVTRSGFNRAKVRAAVVQPSTIYTIALNAMLYSYTSGAADTEADILAGLAAAINDPRFTATVNGGLLYIAAGDIYSANQLILSGNLTTESVTAVVNYNSEILGEIALPFGTITQIVTSVTGLLSVVNLVPYIAGRLKETNVELRQSYADKIFHRSNRMLESIKSAIRLNVQGINAVAAYQNDTNIMDAHGRWPHCIEIVVDGGSDYEIAVQIRDKKAGGIQTFGSVEVIVPGAEGEPMVERFNRPQYVFVWFRIALTLNPAELLPPNYNEVITQIILDAMRTVEPGQSIVPQRLIEARIYGTVPGIGFIETRTYATIDMNENPGSALFNTGAVPITPRQRATTEAVRIEVVLSG